MPKFLRPAALILGTLLLLLALRICLLPPLALLNGDWQPAAARLGPGQVARTEYYRGFFRPTRSFDQSQSRAILAVLQDSSHFRGDTTPDFAQMLIYYDAAGRVLGYTDLDLFSDGMAVAATEPGGFRRGAVMTRQGRQRLLQALGAPPLPPTNIRRQR